MQVSRSRLEKFLGRYKKLRFVTEVNADTGLIEWSAFNSQKRKVMTYKGRKSSILLINKIYTVQSQDREWLEEALQKAKDGVSGA